MRQTYCPKQVPCQGLDGPIVTGVTKGPTSWSVVTLIYSAKFPKNLSQGDIEKRTETTRCYISRVDNGHTVPAIETLEKLTRALGVS